MSCRFKKCGSLVANEFMRDFSECYVLSLHHINKKIEKERHSVCKSVMKSEVEKLTTIAVHIMNFYESAGSHPASYCREDIARKLEGLTNQFNESVQKLDAF
jgi:hypothetical protein